MQQININELKAHPRNNEFFDDMTGDAWEAFKESIKTSGIVEPIVVTQDMIIVSGHQHVNTTLIFLTRNYMKSTMTNYQYSL